MKSQAQRSSARRRQDKRDFEACMHRESHICQRCGAQATQIHHGLRKHLHVRHDSQWHYALCYDCHDWSHRNVMHWLEWMKNNPNEIN